MKKLRRLYQPCNPLFWLMLVLNLLSAVLAWLAQSIEFKPLVAIILAVLAIGNVYFGIRVMILLMREEPQA